MLYRRASCIAPSAFSCLTTRGGYCCSSGRKTRSRFRRCGPTPAAATRLRGRRRTRCESGVGAGDVGNWRLGLPQWKEDVRRCASCGRCWGGNHQTTVHIALGISRRTWLQQVLLDSADMKQHLSCCWPCWVPCCSHVLCPCMNKEICRSRCRMAAKISQHSSCSSHFCPPCPHVRLLLTLSLTQTFSPALLLCISRWISRSRCRTGPSPASATQLSGSCSTSWASHQARCERCGM